MIANASITSYSTLSANPADSLSNYIDGSNVTPTIISTAYNIPSNTASNVKVGIISLGGGWQPSDLQKSLANLSVTLTQSITSVLVDGAGNVFSTSDSNASLENTLDLYCVAGMAPGANIVLYTGQNSVTGFANVVNRAINENCDVISISWGTDEYYNTAGTFLETAFANAAAQGITICVATGDYGSSSTITPRVLSVGYPASSPNVVAVGGTVLTYNTASYSRVTETVSSSSGGGISTVFPVPSWQTGLTYQKYFTSNSSYGPTTALTGRGVPDVSAPFETYVLWYNGTIANVAGTSASTPIIAGMFARYMSMNGGRRPVIDGIHPILYSNINAYSDLTTGTNADPLPQGYAANIGWDPVVGMGAPLGTVLYPMITSGGTNIKTAANTWSYVSNVKVKTGSTTWSNVKAIWNKVNSTTWKQTF